MRPKLHMSDVLAVTFLLLVAAVVYFPVLMPGRTLLPADLLLITPPWAERSAEFDPAFTHVVRRTWDPLFQFYPARKFLADSLRHGWVPLWNPHAFSGTPFAADGQSAVFYPINWLFAVLPLPSAFGIVAFLHTLLTGVFFYLYGRRVGYSRAGSTGGAVVWMLCGVQVGWQMWQVVDSTVCWLPLCLYFWEGFRSHGDLRQGAGLAAALAMSLLAGHLQFAFYVVLATVSYALYRPPSYSAAVRLRSALALLTWVGMGAAMAAVQPAITADLLRLSIRSSAPIGSLLPSALAPSQLGLLVMPELFGGERDYLDHPFLCGQYYENVLYCGASAFVIAIFGLRLKAPKDLSRYWLGLIVFSLLMGCGSPLYNVFYYLVPLYKSFHGLSRIFVLFDFAVAALAAQGLTLAQDELCTDRNKAAKAAGTAVFLIVLALYRVGILDNGSLVASFLTHDWLLFGLTQLAITLLFSGAATLLLLKLPQNAFAAAPLLLAADMLVFASGLNPGSESVLLYPQTPETGFVAQKLTASPADRVLCIADDAGHPQSRITPNGAMSLGWNDVSGSDPLILSRYNNLIQRVNRADTGEPEPAGQGMIAGVGSPVLDALNVRWIVGPATLTKPQYQLAVTGAVNIYENATARGPAWFVPMNLVLSKPDSSVAAQSALFWRSNKVIVGSLRSQPGIITRPNVPSDTDKISVMLDGPGRINAVVDASVPGIFVISETFCPGWTCIVGGKSCPVRVVDGLFSGVFLAEGRHAISFAYEPATFRVGYYISGLGWLLAAGTWSFGLCRRLTHLLK